MATFEKRGDHRGCQLASELEPIERVGDRAGDTLRGSNGNAAVELVLVHGRL
jgi:hypothetical protein